MTQEEFELIENVRKMFLKRFGIPLENAFLANWMTKTIENRIDEFLENALNHKDSLAFQAILKGITDVPSLQEPSSPVVESQSEKILNKEEKRRGRPKKLSD